VAASLDESVAIPNEAPVEDELELSDVHTCLATIEGNLASATTAFVPFELL